MFYVSLIYMTVDIGFHLVITILCLLETKLAVNKQ